MVLSIMDDRFRQPGLPSSSGNQDDEGNQVNQGNQSSQNVQNGQTNHGNQFRPGASQQFSSPQSHVHTLPPLTGGHSSFQYGHNNSHTSLGSLPPSTSGTNASSAIPSIGGHATLRPIQPSPSFSLPNTSFASSQPSLHSSATAHAHPHSLVHAPLPGALQDIRQGGMGVPGHSQLFHPFPPSHDSEPVHVVGQQGRRGVLPTHPGRPPPAQGKTPAIPTKNADNKFECPHCIKTYLHLKHLKRHLLRHTGERPYQCHLCKDTFSRSDILKRHFQKCSLRRGNPTGAHHLTHAQNHLKNRVTVPVPDTNSYMGHMNTSMAYSDGAYTNSLMGVSSMGPEASGYPDALRSMSARTSRSNSLIQSATGVEENRRSLSSIEAYSRVNFDGNGYRTSAGLQNGVSHASNPYASQQTQPSQMSTSTNAYGYGDTMGGSDLTQGGTIKPEANGPLPYGRPPIPNANGMNSAQENGMRWNGAFTAESQDNFAFQSSMTSNDVAHDGMFNGLYTGGPGFVGANPMLPWTVDSSDPLQAKADSLVSYCYPDPSLLVGGSNEAQGAQSLKNLLTAENLRHFVDQYRHFHAHWPMLHLPTFDMSTTNNGLLLVIVCIGAVYSDKLGVRQVRWLMDLAKTSVQRSSQIFKTVSQSRTIPNSAEFNGSSDIEDVAALCLLHALFSWHGSPQQRQEGRDEFWILVRIARHLRLNSVMEKGQLRSSILHRPGPLSVNDFEEWNWETWIEQEKRIRIFYLIFLLDVALGIFFNCVPNFDVNEIKLPLPADDAAWEARTPDECAAALGLRGEAAQIKNNTGSKRSKQMEMWEILQYLHKGVEYQPRSTNAYGKFIIIHGLHNQILQIQRQYHAQVVGINNSNGAANTHLSSQHTAWQQRLRTVSITLEHWKKAWEMDQQIQYPPTQRRAGYCRDAIHYYFLAKMFLRAQKHEELEMPPDRRCQQVFAFLKQIKAFVATEQEKRGFDIGSVTNVDDSYGVEELTLDMKLLFTPLNDFAD